MLGQPFSEYKNTIRKGLYSVSVFSFVNKEKPCLDIKIKETICCSLPDVKSPDNNPAYQSANKHCVFTDAYEYNMDVKFVMSVNGGQSRSHVSFYDS